MRMTAANKTIATIRKLLQLLEEYSIQRKLLYLKTTIPAKRTKCLLEIVNILMEPCAQKLSSDVENDCS